jgi:transcriptional regulator with XRE-family HTH domain
METTISVGKVRSAGAEITETMGDRLRKLREDNGISQKELAKEFFLSNKTVISRYELGIRAVPLEIVQLYSKKFGVTTDWILKGIEDSDEKLDSQSAVPGMKELTDMYVKLGDPSLRAVAIEQMKALLKLAGKSV